MSANRPSGLNRTLLAVLGVLLLGLGAGALAVGLRLLVVPGVDPSVPLLPAEVVPAPWVPYAVVAGAVLLGLLALRWLLAQVRRGPRGSTWRLDAPDDRGTVRIGTDHAAAALAADVGAYRGVAKATATLSGPRQAPQLHLVVHTEHGAPVGPLRERVTSHALPRLCTALGLDVLPADLLLHLDTAGGPRTR